MRLFFIYEGKAILFTAPSQNGKSTQAALWQKYEGAEIINGDRALLREIDGIWYVFGYPCCGSSNICKNKAAPLKTIVVLVQGQENQMISLTTGEKIRGIVSATELYVWNKKEVDVAFELAQQLSEQVPIVKLSCTPDKDAVECLKKYLEENA